MALTPEQTAAISTHDKQTLFNMGAESLTRVKDIADKLNTYARQAEQVFAKEQPIIDAVQAVLGDWTPEQPQEVPESEQ